MPKGKQYGPVDAYQRKLERVMKRLGIEDYDFSHSRREAWVQFRYKGQLYRFQHSADAAKALGLDVPFGTDCFAQIVLSLEDLARMVERGIYDLPVWIAGMKMLPEHVELPSCLGFFGFKTVPALADLENKYRELVKLLHPDIGGSNQDFLRLQHAYEQAQTFLKTTEGGGFGV